MAPRGRPRKRSTRMAAAVDAMGTLGFEAAFVMKTVKKLLDIYGEEGWPFIEEYGYKELIDELLRDSDTTEEGNLEMIDPLGNEVADAMDEDVPGPSNAAASGLVSSGVADFAPELENINMKSPSSSIYTNVKNICNTADVPIAIEHGNCSNEMNTKALCAVSPPVWPSSQKKSDGFLNTSVNPVQERNLQHTPTVRVPTDSPVPQQVAPQPARRRRPCYGWIESDEEDELELIYLSPVGNEDRPKPFSNTPNLDTNKEVKRQSRWDLKP